MGLCLWRTLFKSGAHPWVMSRFLPFYGEDFRGKLASSCTSAAILSLAFNPSNVVTTRMGSQPATYPHVFNAFRRIYGSEGSRAFLLGAPFNVLGNVLSRGVYMAVFAEYQSRIRPKNKAQEFVYSAVGSLGASVLGYSLAHVPDAIRIRQQHHGLGSPPQGLSRNLLQGYVPGFKSNVIYSFTYLLAYQFATAILSRTTNTK